VITVAAFTGGVNVPSARFRVRQYIPALQGMGIKVNEFISSLGAYPPRNRAMRPLWMAGTLSARLPDIVRSYSCDLTFLQREMLSTLVTLEGFTRKPRVLDVDDAIFLYHRGRFAKQLARLCDLIICGNDYIAENFARWNKNITTIPTPVDTRRYMPKKNTHGKQQSVIGWIGTSANFKYLYRIEAALSQVLRHRPRAKLRIIADCEPIFREIAMERVESIRWDPEIEVEGIQGMTIGIMPLDDSDWGKAKCSFKMLSYMACGLPVVVSPVGMNKQVMSLGHVGMAASAHKEWVEALLELLSNEELRKRMGRLGRRIVQYHFSLDVIAPRLAECLRKVAR
jgi:glycosyltransferase involved in cell wall biosynthesis